MNSSMTIEKEVHFGRKAHGRKVIERELPPKPTESGRVPRIARLMALGIRFEGLVRSGAVSDYTALAELGHVSRARVTQIMNLLCLAPDIQEQILFLPRTERGRDPIKLADVLPVAAFSDWRRQREIWQRLRPVLKGDQRG
jgi:hypothetical protein